MQDESKSTTTTSKKIQLTSQGKWLFSFLALICFASLALLLFMSGDVGSQPYEQAEKLLTQHSKVQVMPINIKGSYERKRIIYGQVESAKQADVGFDISGAMASVTVSEGEYVREGQRLADLDIDRLLSRENELIAQLNRVKSERSLAEVSAKRVSDLVDRNLEPQQNLDEAKANLDTAIALVNEVEALLESLQLEKEKSTLKAPFAGQIVTQLVDQGTVLNSGQAVFTIITDEILEARFGLPDDIAFGIQYGEQRPLKLGSAENTILVDAKVISIAKKRNLATRTIDVVFSIDKDAPDIGQSAMRSAIQGDLVSIEVGFEVDKKGAWIPLSALSSGVRGLWSVLVYQPNNQQLEVRTVAVEQLEQTRVFVSGAVRQDELIVVNGTHRFVPGQRVEQVEKITLENENQVNGLTLIRDRTQGTLGRDY